MNGSPPPSHSGSRLLHLDWLRGLAVLVMMEAHTIDAWTRAADKRSVAYGVAMLVGGFAAPLFLWLVGVATALSGARVAARAAAIAEPAAAPAAKRSSAIAASSAVMRNRAAAANAICRRGLEIFILAFLFRLQAFIVSPGSHPITLFRVDILNVMGPAIAASGAVWLLARSPATLTVAYAFSAAVIAMITPIVRVAPMVDALPPWVQWYLRPAGEHTTFTAFPWAGFVFAGAACGMLLTTTRTGTMGERRLHRLLAAAGAALVVLGFYTSTRPAIYRASSFWSSSPTWFAIRVGLMMMALAGVLALARTGVRRHLAGVFLPLERLGQRSLFVYWIHVELVYGYASWWWRHRLPLWGAISGWLVFSAIIYGIVVLRDRVLDNWRNRASLGRHPMPEPATAWN